MCARSTSKRSATFQSRASSTPKRFVGEIGPPAAPPGSPLCIPVYCDPEAGGADECRPGSLTGSAEVSTSALR